MLVVIVQTTDKKESNLFIGILYSQPLPTCLANSGICFSRNVGISSSIAPHYKEDDGELSHYYSNKLTYTQSS
jgi:hypothetical protein